MGGFKSCNGRRNQTWDTSFHFRRDVQRGSTSLDEMQVPAEDVRGWQEKEASQAMVAGRIFVA